MAIRRLQRASIQGGKLDPIIELWVLRILVPLGAHREFIRNDGFANDALAEALGLGRWIDPDGDDFEPRSVRAELRRLHKTAEMGAGRPHLPECLRNNVARLSHLVGLGETDQRILEFAVSIHNERVLDDVADWLGYLASNKVCQVLSVILNESEQSVRTALSPQGILARSGLVSVDRSGHGTLRNKLDLLSTAFADLMASSDADALKLLRGTVVAATPGHLSLSDYAHVQTSLDILQPYLRSAIEARHCGVNIYIHGAPGTGKTQLARTLAQALNCPLFEVANEDANGEPISGGRRLRAFHTAQAVFADAKALLVFDEVEDVFNDGEGLFGRKSTAQTNKGWLNRALEDNPLPTLWLSNTARGLDPAFVRRFDMVFELPVPPKAQRERLLQTACGDLLEPVQIARIAEIDVLAPALVTRASAVVRTIQGALGRPASAAAFEHLIGNTLEAQGHRRPVRHDATRLPEIYDPQFIHADADLAELVEGLRRARTGRLCLYGPPGTGKTAYARWLAEQLAMPLLIKRASDLFSKWLGESEKEIANAFREAEAEGAVLLIDEVDSFLQDRRRAEHGWQVGLVNEMLTQMESFSGVFVASTNLMEGLDPATLRRFDLKVKFDFLRHDQTQALFARCCSAMGIKAPTSGFLEGPARLQNVTPGDFAAIRRQHRFLPITSAQAFLQALEAECSLKEAVPSSIGFA